MELALNERPQPWLAVLSFGFVLWLSLLETAVDTCREVAEYVGYLFEELVEQNWSWGKLWVTRVNWLAAGYLILIYSDTGGWFVRALSSCVARVLKFLHLHCWQSREEQATALTFSCACAMALAPYGPGAVAGFVLLERAGEWD